MFKPKALIFLVVICIFPRKPLQWKVAESHTNERETFNEQVHGISLNHVLIHLAKLKMSAKIMYKWF